MTRGKLSEALVFCIDCAISLSHVFTVCVHWSLVQFGHFPASSPSFFGFLVYSPLLVKMRHQGKRNRSGDRQGSGKWPSVSHLADPSHSPINLTSSPEDLPPSSPGRKPVPNSAFQTTHFKFQSNLNRPLITAHITIILSEEENQISPLSCIMPNPSHSSERTMDEGE